VLIRPSPLGAILVGAIHALAAVAVFAVLPAVAALICMLGLAISAGVHVGGLLQWWRGSVREITLRPDGGAAWRAGDGTWHSARTVSGGVLAPWLMVIGLNETGGSLRTLLVLPDALASESLRELRVWLKWRPQPRRPMDGSVI
jgi:hypothetical protein